MLELGLTILELPPIGGKLETRLLATRGTCQELSCVIFRHPEPCHQVKVPLYTIRLKRSIRKYGKLPKNEVKLASETKICETF